MESDGPRPHDSERDSSPGLHELSSNCDALIVNIMLRCFHGMAQDIQLLEVMSRLLGRN